MLVASIVQSLALFVIAIQLAPPASNRGAVEIYVRGSSVSVPAAPRLARSGAKTVLVIDGAIDPSRRSFAAASPADLCAAVRAVHGRKLPDYALVDLPWQAVGNGLATSDPAVARMTSVLKALKADFPETRFAWRGIPNLPVGTGAEPQSLLDRQLECTTARWRSFAAECDWLNPDPTLTGPLLSPGILESWMQRTARVCADIAPAKRIVPSVSQWTSKTTTKGQSFRLGVPPSTITAQVRSLRAAGADAIMFAEPRGLPRTTAQLASTTLAAAAQSVRLADAAWLKTAPATIPAPIAAAPAPSPSTTATEPAAPKFGAAPLTQATATSATPADALAVPATAAVQSAERALGAIGQRPLPPMADTTLRFDPTNWDSVYELAANSAELREMLAGLNATADRIATGHGREMYVRPQNYGQVPASMVDPALQSLQPAARRDMSQLAIVDTIQTNYLRTNGVILAVVAKRTRNAAYLAKCIDMLESLNAYVPLQRPGYTYGTQSIAMTPDGDGVWLATAWGMDAIIEMLSVLGDDVPRDLQLRLRRQLREEIARIAGDWADRRPWFVKSRAFQSNQWLEPNIALVKACLFLGDPALRPAYELGAQNIALSLGKLGSDGSFNEGVSYAEMTVERLHEVLECMRRAGDLRCASSGFARNNWRWFAQMLMPGRMLVNSYDSALSRLPSYNVETPLSGFGAAALATADAEALPTVRSLFPRFRGNYSVPAIRLAAALAAAQTPSSMLIVPHAFFPDQQHLTWRSEFQAPSTPQTALGLWLKGGSPGDNHCHRDQGQVSVYRGDRQILIDCGTPEYSAADYDSYYSATAGHGTFQYGALRPNGAPVSAPITVRALGNDGGEVSINCTAAYPVAESFVRGVSWTRQGTFRIDDRVSLRSAAPAGSELFRFHTGSASVLQVQGAGRNWTIAWDGAEMALTSTVDIDVSQLRLPDKVTASQVHQAIIIRCVEDCGEIGLTSVLRVQ